MTDKEYFTGKIIEQQKKKVYHRNNQWYGQIFYKLTVANHSQQQTIFAYPNLIKQTLWSLIETKNYQSNYLFTTQKIKKRLVLLDFQSKS